METIYTIDLLSQRIKELETKQRQEWSGIKNNFEDLKSNLKPLNLIRHTVEEINDTVGFKGNLAQSVISIGIGYLAKKFIVGKSESKVKNVFGSLLQLIVTNLVSKKQEAH